MIVSKNVQLRGWNKKSLTLTFTYTHTKQLLQLLKRRSKWCYKSMCKGSIIFISKHLIIFDRMLNSVYKNYGDILRHWKMSFPLEIYIVVCHAGRIGNLTLIKNYVCSWASVLRTTGIISDYT